MSNIILIIGAPGSGKTWIMQQLINYYNINKDVYTYQAGQYKYVSQHGIVIVGVYDGSTFQGSDRLSMSVMQSNDKAKSVFEKAKYVFLEGDRFTNSTFINTFHPLVIKITDDGEHGRQLRGSSQTERQIKSITTRVGNIQADMEFDNSDECLNYIKQTYTN
jgi:hypothetical protein